MKNSEIVDIQEDMRVNVYGSTVGYLGTPLGEAFTHYIEAYGLNNIHFICSLVYGLGKMHGKREERARRKNAKLREGIR